MDNKKEVKKYLNKYFKAQYLYFKAQYLEEYDNEFKSLVRLLNKAQKQVKNSKTILHQCSCKEGHLVEVKICLNCDGILE